MTAINATRHPSAVYSSRVLQPDGRISPACIVSEDGWITNVSNKRTSGALAAGNLLILPGIVDIHGDAFERQLRPRPTAGFSIPIALRETDRQLITNGITTAFYGITVSWEPGLRSARHAAEIILEMERSREALAADTKVHLRFETRTREAIGEVCEWIRLGKGDWEAHDCPGLSTGAHPYLRGANYFAFVLPLRSEPRSWRQMELTSEASPIV